MAKSSTIFGAVRKFSDQAPAVMGGGQIPAVQYSTGNARALADFSRSLFTLSSQFEDQLDQQAEAEGMKEGAMQGLSGNYEEQSYETIRGRAYNRAMLETFVTTVDTETMVGLERLKQQHWADPAGLERSANDYINGKAAALDQIAPGAGAAFRQRQAARLLPAIEQERDQRYKLTQDEAEAQKERYEATLLTQLQTYAGDMFSDNPARSNAASAVLHQTVSEYMKIYDAVDPVTGRPLFTQAAKEKARQAVRDTVMEKATLGWFDQQEDPVGAYMKMQDPEFSFKVLERVGGNAKQSKEFLSSRSAHRTRMGDTSNLDDTFATNLASLIQSAPAEIGPGLQLGSAYRSVERQQELWNAALKKYGSAAKARRWVAPPGGSYHGKGQAVDLWYNGQRLDQAPKHVRDWVHENAPKFGMHFPLGNEPWHIEPHGTRGTKPATAQETVTNRPLRQTMSPAAWERIDAEMRQRISFMNTQTDRQRLAEEREQTRIQDAASVEVSTRIFAAGQEDPATGKPIQPITSLEIRDLARAGILSRERADSFIKQLETERPEKSDKTVYVDLMARIENGEDVFNEILGNADKLTQDDLRGLIDRNRTRAETVGKLSPMAQRSRDRLKDMLEPNPMLGGIDFEDRKLRQAQALAEFDRRALAVQESGEDLDEVASEIGNRSKTQTFDMSINVLDRLVLPRFSVAAQGPSPRWIDVAQSAKALLEARATGKITAAEFEAQNDLLLQWHTMQEEVMRSNSANQNKGKAK